MTREEMEELKWLAASMGLYDDKNPCKRAVILGKAIKELEQSRTGHWIENRAKNYPGWIHCSECGEDWTHDGRPPYCPACGAGMTEIR